MPSPRVVQPGFHHRVYTLVRTVPEGWVTTYGDVAAALGSPRVARHVGWALSALSEDDVPWHRVINAKGRISLRDELGRANLQQQLLCEEGLTFRSNGVVEDFTERRWAFEVTP